MGRVEGENKVNGSECYLVSSYGDYNEHLYQWTAKTSRFQQLRSSIAGERAFSAISMKFYKKFTANKVHGI